MMNEQLQGLKQALLEEERVNDYQWAYRVPGTYNKYNYKKLVNMDIEELKKVYKFCNEMLYNGDRKHQGRTVVRDKIIGVIDKLNAEYMIREDMVKSGMSKQQILDIIRTQKRGNKAVFGDIVSADYKYAKIPLKIIANACKNHLGLFDSGIVSYTFVTKLGVKHDDYFAEKYKKFVEKEGACSPSDYIHKYLNISKEDFKCFTSKTGLTLKEAEIATNLKSCDYRDLTSEEILLLSEKLLPLILSKIEKQIDEWEERKMQIEEVAVKLCLKL